MKTFKVIQKPSGILGLTFEDLKFLLIFVMLGFMFLNFLNYVVKVPKLGYLAMIVACVMAVVFLKKANRKGRYFFVQSWLAWPLTPRRIYVRKKITLFDVHVPQKKKDFQRKGLA
jgi:hypothetical protein